MTTWLNQILIGDVLDRLRELPDDSVHCVITSPPYWRLRDYEIAGQIGLEESLDAYVQKMVEVFREVRRVLRPDGTLWLNMGDTWAGSGKGRNGDGHHGSKGGDKQFTNQGSIRGVVSNLTGSGLKNKDLCMIPARVALALQADGWWLRLDNVWKKPNPMPSPQDDRPTLQHEYVYLLSKTDQCYYDNEAVKEPCTGNAHGRGSGVHSKIKRPSGWDPTAGWGSHRRRKGHYEPKQNESFSAAVNEIVTTRTMRSVWEIPTEGFPGELCQKCDRYYESKPASGHCACGAHEWLAHFATFPQRLVSKCLLAGTSEKGACTDCGSPWDRVFEVTYTNPGNRQTNGDRSAEASLSHEWSAGYAQRLERETKTVGWQPGCECRGKFKRIPRPKGKRNPGETFRLPRRIYTSSPVCVSCGFVVESQRHDKHRASESVRGVRTQLQASGEQDALSQQAVRPEMDSSPPKKLEGKDGGGEGLHTTVDARTSQRGEDGVRLGTPLCDVTDSGAPSQELRDRSPQKRKEEGQPRVQSATSPEAGARQAPARKIFGEVPSVQVPIRVEGKCPACGGALEKQTEAVVPCVILDPFLGSGTTALVALKARRCFVGIELSPKYAIMARHRIGPELSQLKLL